MQPHLSGDDRVACVHPPGVRADRAPEAPRVVAVHEGVVACGVGAQFGVVLVAARASGAPLGQRPTNLAANKDDPELGADPRATTPSCSATTREGPPVPGPRTPHQRVPTVITGQVRLRRMIPRHQLRPVAAPGRAGGRRRRPRPDVRLRRAPEPQFKFVQRRGQRRQARRAGPADRHAGRRPFTIPNRPIRRSLRAAQFRGDRGRTASLPACARCAGSPISTPQLEDCVMADRLSPDAGPRRSTVRHTDVYTFGAATSSGPGTDVFPATAATALFSDALSYRSASAGDSHDGQRDQATLADADDTPSRLVVIPDDGPDNTVQAGACAPPARRCRSRRGEVDRAVYGSSRGRGWTRSSSTWPPTATRELERLALRAERRQRLDGADVLGVVLELDSHRARPRPRPAARRGRRDPDLRRIPRARGPAEIKTFILGAKVRS